MLPKVKKKIKYNENAFVSIAKQAKANSDPKVAVRKLFPKCIGERDIGIQEIMHQLMSLKLPSSSFSVAPISLTGLRKYQFE